MDIPLARKVLEHVEIEHTDFTHRQATFYWTPEIEAAYSKLYGHSYSPNVCNTQACLAGTAALLSPEAEIVVIGIESHVEVNGERMDWEDAGRQLLGLTHGQGQSLFYEFNNEAAIARLRNMITEAEAEEVAALHG